MHQICSNLPVLVIAVTHDLFHSSKELFLPHSIAINKLNFGACVILKLLSDKWTRSVFHAEVRKLNRMGYDLNLYLRTLIIAHMEIRRNSKNNLFDFIFVYFDVFSLHSFYSYALARGFFLLLLLHLIHFGWIKITAL